MLPSCLNSRIVGLSALVLALGAHAAHADGDTVQLVGGDVLRGTITSETDAAVTIDHPALGRIEIARERIASVVKAPTPPTAEPAAAVDGSAGTPAPEVPVAVLPAPAPAPPPKPDGSWKFSLGLALTGSDNESQSNWDLRVSGSAKRESETDRTSVTAEYYFQTANSVNTDNNLLVQGLQEWFSKETRWELFAQGNYQYDEFQEWEQRVGAYVGPGYRLFEGAPLELKIRAGAGASYEFPTSSWTPEALIADELVWTIDERSKLKQGFEIYPDFDNLGEYRFIARLEYEIALNAKGDLKGTIGARDEYDSYVEPSGDSSNDLKVYAGIKLDF